MNHSNLLKLATVSGPGPNLETLSKTLSHRKSFSLLNLGGKIFLTSSNFNRKNHYTLIIILLSSFDKQVEGVTLNTWLIYYAKRQSKLH